MSANDNIERVKSAMQIGVRGLYRFYDDGFTRWPRNKLVPLFSNLDLDHPEIQREFQELEKQGVLKISRTEDCYLEVLRVPVD